MENPSFWASRRPRPAPEEISSGLPPRRRRSGSPRSRGVRSSLATIPDLAESSMPPPERVADIGASRAGRARLVTPPQQASKCGTRKSGKPAGPLRCQAPTRDAPGLHGASSPLGPRRCCWRVHCLVSVIFALHRAAWVRGPGQVVPSVDSSHWPPARRRAFR